MKYKEKQNFYKSTVQELAKECETLEGKLKKMKIDRYVKQMKNSREARTIRQKVAVLRTYIAQKLIERES